MIQSRMSSTGFPSAPLDLGSSSTRPGMPASSSTPPPTTTSAHRKNQSGSTMMTSANQRRAACKKKHRRFFVVGFLWYIFVLDPLPPCDRIALYFFLLSTLEFSQGCHRPSSCSRLRTSVLCSRTSPATTSSLPRAAAMRRLRPRSARAPMRAPLRPDSFPETSERR
jgi:hypothetical protein